MNIVHNTYEYRDIWWMVLLFDIFLLIFSSHFPPKFCRI